MKLPAIPVTSFEDATLNMERVQMLLASMNAVAWGSGTLTWPGASTFSNTIAVNHGLVSTNGTSLTPTAVLALSQLPGGAAPTDIHYVSVSSTQIQFRGHTTDGSSPLVSATTLFFWLALA